MPRLKPSQTELKAIEFRASINRYLLLRGMNKKDLAKRTGIPESTLHRHLREQEKFSLSEIRRIRDVLNMPHEEIAKVI